MTSNSDLIIGFSFSLANDGAPGSYNVLLAGHLSTLLEALDLEGAEAPLVALQWEIADAFSDLNPTLLRALEGQKRLVVVEPPGFHEAQIVKTELLKLLQDSRAPHSIRLLAAIREQAITIENLDRLLDDARFYEFFRDLSLKDLIRPKLGSLFTEFRSMPRSEIYPKGLRRYQRRRVNRLIIEAIVDDPMILERGVYLSTAGVIESVLNGISAQALRKIHVLAHPSHSPRCLVQLEHALEARNLKSGLYDSTDGLLMPWDSQSAQVWCRSLDNWRDSQVIVEKMLQSGGDRSGR